MFYFDSKDNCLVPLVWFYADRQKILEISRLNDGRLLLASATGVAFNFGKVDMKYLLRLFCSLARLSDYSTVNS